MEILPKKICETCFNAICQTYLLRQKMNEAQCVLQEIVSDQVEEKYEIEVDDMDIIENIEYNYEDDIAVEHLIMEEVPPDEIDEPNSYSESKEEIFHETPELSQSPSPIKFEPIAFPFDDTSEAPPEFAREFDKTLQEFDREVALEKCTIYECTRCLLSYKNTKRYLEHMNMHEMEDEKICNICNLQCETTEEYNQHKENHKYDQMFTCVICEEKFDKQLSYKRHIRDAHEENPKQRKRVLCDLCGKAVPSAHSLEIHMRKHTGELPFHCVECDRSFAMEYSFTHHMKLHLPPELLYSCETCGNRFTTPRLLKKHKEIHSGIQPYSCELCGRCFRIKRNFEVFMLLFNVHMWNCAFISKFYFIL